MEGIDLEQERKEILNAYKGLLRASKDLRTEKETRKIRKAFNVALDAHKDMRRKSGEPYIYHPIAVARICAEEMGLGATAIICALLHDTVEDTHISLQDIEDLFGERERKIIDGLTKIPEVFDDNLSLQAENFRKLILTISDDLRVVMIKIADRLHNMRTLESMRVDKQIKIASETQFLYAPLAHRLGLYAIKMEMEDLSLKYKNPTIYNEIESKLIKSKDIRDRFIRRFVAPIKESLSHEGYVYDIKARTKSISSIYRKMQKKSIPFEEVYDIFAVRIIVDTPVELEKPDCWRIYSMITDYYQPNPDRLRDWISTPKANGYESLHTTVMSPTGKWVEVQIRSKRMDEIAEKGFAAHYKYKENSNDASSKFDRWISEIRDLLENPEANALDFIDDFKLNLFADEIYVFTPKGDLKVLPRNSTTLDFAFDIHTDIGLKCIGAKVNNRLVPLSHQLKSGDQVEIITSSKQKPSEDWLKFVVTARSRSKIKASLNEERRSIAMEGKEILSRKLNRLKIPASSENITVLEKFFGFPSTTELYYRVAKRKIDLSEIRDLDFKDGKLKIRKEPQQQIRSFKEVIDKVDNKKDTIVIGDDFKHIDYKLSPCCTPIPGDDIFGFITINDGIKIHRVSCPNATQMLSNYAYRVIKARWKSQKLEEREVDVHVKGIDDVGIVNKITDIISKQHSVNMRSISFSSNDGMFTGDIKLLVYDTEHLESLINKFEQIEGVSTVERTSRKIQIDS